MPFKLKVLHLKDSKDFEMKIKRIMIVEDEPDNMKILCYALSSRGYDIVPVENGDDALRSLESEAVPPDFIFLDLQLPGSLAGGELCRRIRSQPRFRKIPVVIVTATAMGRDQQQAFLRDTQANAYILKPFELEDIFSQISTWDSVPASSEE